MARKTKTSATDHYAAIAAEVIASMKSGVAPWQRPWRGGTGGIRNAVTRKAYRGLNTLRLMLTAWDRNYTSSLWLTFKQANELAAKAAKKAGHAVELNARKMWVYADGENKGRSVGGIRKGQNAANDCGATTVFFWKRLPKTEKTDNGDEKEKKFMMMRTYQVFNLEQCDQAIIDYMSADTPAPEFTPLEAAERICKGLDVTTRHGGNRAFYQPKKDFIQLPKRTAFGSPEEYYTTRFHEMGHATGAVQRLNRDGVANFDYFGSHQYSAEELVAEFTATFLAAEAGIERAILDNSAAYLRTWAKKLEDDPKVLIDAVREAQKAADYIMGTEFASESSTEAAEAA